MKAFIFHTLLIMLCGSRASAQQLEATLQSNHIALQWKLYPQHTVDHCEVQRRGRGTAFRTIALVLADNDTSSKVYRYRDKLLGSESFLYYRIRTVFSNGTEHYSDIVAVPVHPGAQAPLAIISLRPNTIQLQLPAAHASYLLRKYRSDGVLVATRRSRAGTCNWNIKKLKSGVYFIEAYLPINGRRYYGSFRNEAYQPIP